MLGVVNEFPVPNAEPPVEAANQLRVPTLAVAVSVTVPGSQREPPVADVIAGAVFTVATTALRFDIQLVVDAST